MQLVETIQERYTDEFEVDIADLRALPYFDQDEELDPPASVKAFKQQIAEADAVLIVTPEITGRCLGF